jgi:hypothetical protein
MKYAITFLLVLLLLIVMVPGEDTLAYKLTKKLEERQQMIREIQGE